MDTSNTHSDSICSNQVEGTSVYNSRGDKLGSIEGLMIDKRSGQVNHAVLEFGGFLGIGTDRYPVPWSMLKYNTRLDGYEVPFAKDRLENAPRFPNTGASPCTTDLVYSQRINDYYGQ